jgi:hypothetical protein
MFAKQILKNKIKNLRNCQAHANIYKSTAAAVSSRYAGSGLKAIRRNNLSPYAGILAVGSGKYI